MRLEKTFKWITGIAALCLVLAAGTTALAASDGALDLTSTGDTIVSITKGDVAQITGMGDIGLAPWTNGQPAPAGLTSACVFSSTTNYQVTATSANTGGTNFRLRDGGTNFIVYTVQWNDGNGGGPAAVAGGTPLTARVGSNVAGCGGTTPAQVLVAITNGAMNGAAVSSYSDTLTLVIAPE
jgi:hypothetical protein